MQVIPVYERGSQFQPSAIEMVDGQTSPPQLLTEADLISLMEKHGIGKLKIFTQEPVRDEKISIVGQILIKQTSRFCCIAALSLHVIYVKFDLFIVKLSAVMLHYGKCSLIYSICGSI